MAVLKASGGSGCDHREGGDDSVVDPSKSCVQSSVDEELPQRPQVTQRRRLLHVDGRSSSETSGGSADKMSLDVTGRAAMAVQRVISVDEGVHLSSDRQHVSCDVLSGGKRGDYPVPI